MNRSTVLDEFAGSPRNVPEDLLYILGSYANWLKRARVLLVFSRNLSRKDRAVPSPEVLVAMLRTRRTEGLSAARRSRQPPHPCETNGQLTLVIRIAKDSG